jgi:hypothetical protein
MEHDQGERGVGGSLMHTGMHQIIDVMSNYKAHHQLQLFGLTGGKGGEGVGCSLGDRSAGGLTCHTSANALVRDVACRSSDGSAVWEGGGGGGESEGLGSDVAWFSSDSRDDTGGGLERTHSNGKTCCHEALRHTAMRP